MTAPIAAAEVYWCGQSQVNTSINASKLQKHSNMNPGQQCLLLIAAAGWLISAGNRYASNFRRYPHCMWRMKGTGTGQGELGVHHF